MTRPLARSLLAPVAGLALAAGPLPAQPLTLAERGQPAACTIVRPADASPSQVFAAEELQRFTAQMTGVTLPIATDEGPLPERSILLGDTRHTAAVLGAPADLAPLGDDGFRLKTCPPHLLVLGGPVRGTLYGVYELLEAHGGCRWFTTWHGVVPRLDAWRVAALDDTQVPAFAMREPFWFDFFDGDLAARNKANGNGLRLEPRHGGKVRFGGGLFVHTFNALCPPDEFFASHPEYFSEVDGQRIKDHTQLCLTNPEVARIVTERLLAHIRQDPQAKLFSVSQNDWHNCCTCPACKELDEREGSHAGTLIAFVNQVAEAVEKEFPDAWIETLAYQYTRQPPRTIRPRHNVVPRLCTIECDFSKPLPASPDDQNQRFMEQLGAWAAMSDKLYIWDYTTNFRAYTAPFPNVLALQDNLRVFRDHRVAGVFEQGAYQGRHADFAELKAWLLAKWLWNPELPADRLLDDFFAGYYGAAASHARHYFDEAHAFYQGPGARLRVFDGPLASLHGDAFLARAATLWDQAAAAVRDDPARACNVRMGAIPVLHARLERLPNPPAIKVWLASDTARYAVPAPHRELATDLLARLREAGNVRLAESQGTHDALLARWQHFATYAPPPPDPARDRATVEDALLTLGRRGEWGETAADPLAGDGSALKLFNTHFEWSATLPFQQVAFDPGVPHRIRIRVRVEPEPGRDGEAFWAGIHDPLARQGHGLLAPTTAQAGADYAWYDLPDWTPAPHHYFWIGPGRFDKEHGSSAVRAVFLDKLEIVRAGSPPETDRAAPD